MTALLGTSNTTTPAVEGDNTGGGYGLRGVSNSTGVYAQTTGSGCQGLYANSGQNTSWAIYAEAPSAGIGGISYASTNGLGVYGACNSGSSNGSGNAGVYGVGNNYGVYGTSAGGGSTGGIGGYFANTASSGGTAVYAVCNNGDGIFASSGGSYSNAGYFYYTGTTGTALTAYCATAAKALQVIGNSLFSGTASFSGYVTKSGGGFLVDHPQDPENKMLNHCFVESPEMKNVYDGTIVLDSKGEATVSLPSYFESANSDFRYQLTAIGASMPNLFVSVEVSNNQFSISGGAPGKKVSWQVTGVRADKWALANHPGVEITKKTPDTYLHPELFGKDASKRVDRNGDSIDHNPRTLNDHQAPTIPVTNNGFQKP